MKKSRKQASRLLKVSGLGIQVGGSYLKQKMREMFTNIEEHLPERLEMHMKNAQRIADTLGEMKGTMMKLGQMLSLNRELFPREFTDVLETLQSQAPPRDFKEIRKVVEGELGKTIKQVFSSFEPEPIASASIGQVHRAQLKDGRQVVAKVQYPGVDEDVEGDLKNIKLLLTSLKQLGGGFDLTHLMHELRERMLEELDYKNEAGNMKKFREIFAQCSWMRIPEPVDAVCTKRLLVMTYLPGTPFADFCKDEKSGTKRNRLSESLMRFYLMQLFDHQMLHADPNPGNFAVGGEGELLVYDFGCVKVFPQAFVQHYKKLLRDYLSEDFDSIPLDFEKLGFKNISDRTYSVDFFRKYAELLMEPFSTEPYSFGDADLQNKILKVAKEELSEVINFKPPSHIVFHNRVVVGAYNNLRSLRATGYWKSLLNSFIQPTGEGN